MTNDPHHSGFPIGSRIAERYEVTGSIGSGGFGVVLSATDTAAEGRPVAIKVLHTRIADEQIFLERFKREQQICLQLTHPNIVKAFDLGELPDGRLYLVLEFVEGRSLKELLEERDPPGLPFPLALTYLKQILSGLAEAHRQGLVHRDIKPGNILVSTAGEVKITDFGIARTDGSTLTKTADRRIMGSPAYISPEMIRHDKKKISPATDIYSLGMVAYEMVAGRAPFAHDSIVEVMIAKHLTQNVPELRATHPTVPAWYDEMFEQATAKNPGDRFPSADAMVKFIEEAEQGRPSPSLSFSLLMLGLSILLVVLALLFWFTS